MKVYFVLLILLISFFQITLSSSDDNFIASCTYKKSDCSVEPQNCKALRPDFCQKLSDNPPVYAFPIVINDTFLRYTEYTEDCCKGDPSFDQIVPRNKCIDYITFGKQYIGGNYASGITASYLLFIALILLILSLN
eukprot:TRINITY_DN1507_c0_g1_i1.p1 TRINITY_DN1507_c0_g1~~TRINITY_DN1507_c0_g1_i1.p1  ORF type:complete len:136 (-),score=20.28 TRINITY_DN1507_c0_g1_i1:31-438(-)